MFGIFFPFGDGRRVIVTGRSTIDRTVKALRWGGPSLIVGFHDPGSIVPPWPNHPHIVDKVITECHDLDAPPAGIQFAGGGVEVDENSAKLFEQEHALAIKKMFLRHGSTIIATVNGKDPVARTTLDTAFDLVFQCEAGLSRSAAAAAATVRWLGGDDTVFFQARYPNHRIYSYLLRTYLGLPARAGE